MLNLLNCVCVIRIYYCVHMIRVMCLCQSECWGVCIIRVYCYCDCILRVSVIVCTLSGLSVVRALTWLSVIVRALLGFFVACALQGSNAVQSIHLENVDRSEKLPTQIMEGLLETFSIPSNKQVVSLTISGLRNHVKKTDRCRHFHHQPFTQRRKT